MRKHKIDILNVAGPRQSEWPEGYDYAYRALDIFLTNCSGVCVKRANTELTGYSSLVTQGFDRVEARGEIGGNQRGKRTDEERR